MDTSNDAEILSQFAQVRARHQLAQLVAQSELPYPRKEILAAIRRGNDKEAALMAEVELEAFVPDEDANLVGSYRQNPLPEDRSTRAAAVLEQVRLAQQVVLDRLPRAKELREHLGVLARPVLLGASADKMQFHQVAPSTSRIKPRRLGCLMTAGLFLFAVPAGGLGAAAMAGGSTAFGGLFVGLGLLMALLPAAYLVGAEVTVTNGAFKKVVLYRTVVECPARLVGSIRWFESTSYVRGYEFQRSDGHRICRLSAFWWSDKDVTRLGRQLGLVIDWGAYGT